MKIKTSIKSGGAWANHNETLARPAAKPSLKVKTSLKAGALGLNHNETLVRPQPRRALKVKSHLKAGQGVIVVPGGCPQKP